MMLPMTLLLACALAVLLIVLSLLVVIQRRVLCGAQSDAGDLVLNRRIRAQANLTEYAPMFVILIALAGAVVVNLAALLG